MFTSCRIFGGYDVFFLSEMGAEHLGSGKLWKVTPMFFAKRRALPARWAPYQLEIELVTLHTWPYKIFLMGNWCNIPTCGSYNSIVTGFWAHLAGMFQVRYFSQIWQNGLRRLWVWQPETRKEKAQEKQERRELMDSLRLEHLEQLCPNVSKFDRCFTQNQDQNWRMNQSNYLLRYIHILGEGWNLQLAKVLWDTPGYTNRRQGYDLYILDEKRDVYPVLFPSKDVTWMIIPGRT